MKFLVIGGAGYIGSHFIYEAIAQDHECLAYDNLSTGHREAVHPQSAFQEGDIHDRAKLVETIEAFQPDAIFHFAAFALVGESTENPSKYYYNNVEGVRVLLEVVRGHAKNASIIFSSTCAVFGEPSSLPIDEGQIKNPISPYGRSKLMAEYLLEDYAKAYGLRAVSLRYFNACGAHSSGAIGEGHDPETHLIPNVIGAALGRQSLKIFGDDFPTDDGSCIRDYIHVEDLAAGHILAQEYIGRQAPGSYDVFHLGTGNGFSNLQIVREVEAVMGKEIDYTIGERRLGDPPQLFASIQKAKELLGFHPQKSDLKTIISSAIKWHKNPASLEL